MAQNSHRVDALTLPDSCPRLNSASHYFLSKGMLVEAMTAAATLAGLCLTDKLMSIVTKQGPICPDEWLFSIKDIISGAIKVLSPSHPTLPSWVCKHVHIVVTQTRCRCQSSAIQQHKAYLAWHHSSCAIVCCAVTNVCPGP